MSCLEKVSLIVLSSLVSSLQKLIIFMSKIDKNKSTFDALVVQFLVFVESGFVGGDEELNGRFVGEDLNLPGVDSFEPQIKRVDLPGKVAFVLISV